MLQSYFRANRAYHAYAISIKRFLHVLSGDQVYEGCFRASSQFEAMAFVLAYAWEKCVLVRNRFKRGISWLQWPVPNPDSDLDDLHAPSTRALELNVEVLRTMTIELDGNNIEIPRLEKEAHSRFINKDSGSLGCVGFLSWLQTRQCVRGCFGLCLCMYVCGGKCMNSCVVSLSISSFPLPSSPRLNCLCLHTPFSSFTYLIFYLPMCLCLFSPSPIWPLLYMHKIVQIFIHRLLLYPGPKFPVYFKGFPDVMTSCILALSLLCLSLSLSLSPLLEIFRWSDQEALRRGEIRAEGSKKCL